MSKVKHTQKTNGNIIIRDLRGNRAGKCSLEFRSEYGMVDVPKIVSVLKSKGYNIYSRRGIEIDHLEIPHERIARYWLISEPETKEPIL